MNIRRRTGSFPGFLLACGLMLLALTFGNSGCSDSVKYTYVDVRVSIDRDTVTATQLFLVTSCEFQVTGADVTSPDNLRCPENQVPYDVGTFQWTSAAKTGTLQFIVQIFDGNHVLLGEGTSDPVRVMPGKALQTSVLVQGVVPPSPPDGGADTAVSTPDGALADAVTTDSQPDGQTTPDTNPSPDGSADGGTLDATADGPAGDASED